MTIEASNPEEYISKVPSERTGAMTKLREVINENLPEGFEEMMNCGMIGYVIPHSLYPSGYHCDTTQPLPFINIASQKNFIAFYHMGIYANQEVLDWFTAEYPKHVSTKLDMGKSCIRFKNPEKIPFDLLGELVSKISAEEWIETYEKNIKC